MKLKASLFGAALASLGLLASAGSSFAATNLITNGDFSAGLTDWSVSSNAYFTDANGYHEGAFAGATGYLSQTFSDTAGKSLELTFNYQGTDGSAFQYVQFDGLKVAGSYVGGLTGYDTYSFRVGFGTGLDSITFVGQNQPTYNTLDNVSVSAVPELSTWAMLMLGFAGLGFAGYRRKSEGAAFAA